MPLVKTKQIQTSSAPDGTYGSINSPGISNGEGLPITIDKMVTILDALVPPSAPNLTSASSAPTGVTGKISFSTATPVASYNNYTPGNAIGTTISITSTVLGIINATTNITGTLANNVATGPGTPSAAYLANAFGNGNIGILQLVLNGTVLHSVDLSLHVSGSSLNINGSGFSALSAIQYSLFPQGTPFPTFVYRTGTFVLSQNEWATTGYGYNTIQIRHFITPTTYSTQTYTYIIDNFTAALSATGPALSGLSMSGSKRLSGVEYHTSGTALYSVTLNDVYRNTYSASGAAISYSGTRCTIPSEAIPTPVSSLSTLVLSNKTVTITSSSTRILGQNIAINTNVLRTVQGTASGLGTASAFAILLDTITNDSTANLETLNSENYRINSAIESNLTTIIGYTSGGASPVAVAYDSSISLTGANVSYNNGLLVFNGKVSYPNNTTGTSVTTGNFGAVANGPAGNPDYTGATGTRFYYRFFHFAALTQNMILQLTATGTTVGTSATGNQIKIEICFPGVTVGHGSWLDTTVSTVGGGAYASTYGTNLGSTTGQNWGLSTLSGLSTGNSGNVVLMKITASSSWTGSVDNISLAQY
jgi:hypothetical protein